MKRRLASVLTLVAAALLLSSCASQKAMNLNIHSEPEGSHVVYRVSKDYDENDAPWIYLGMTPYQGVAMVDTAAFDDTDTITFKVMRNGYFDQAKKWTGADFLDEYERETFIFWAPRLVKSVK